MDEDNTKNFISFLMDLSDLAERAKQEMRGIKSAGRVLTTEEHEAISDLVLCTITDLEIVDSDIQEYERLGFVSDKFAAVK